MGSGDSKHVVAVKAPPREERMPWRRFEENGDWTKYYRDKLVDDVSAFRTRDNHGTATIIFHGFINAGKSSFINSVACIDTSRIACQAIVGTTYVTSQTTKFTQFKPEGCLRSDFKLMDSMGMEAIDGIKIEDVKFTIEGKIQPGYPFNRDIAADKSSTTLFHGNVDKSKEAHCVVFVIDSTILKSGSETAGFQRKLKDAKSALKDYELPTILLLTKIDKSCPELKNNLSQTFDNVELFKIVKKGSELIGIPMKDVFPVQCYSDDISLQTNQDILILLALRQMLNYAYDRMTTKDNQKHAD